MYPFASPMMIGQAAAAAILRPQDVFAISLYTGTDAPLTITTGLDHLGKGGLTWAKARNVSGAHALFDTKRAFGNTLRSNSINREDVGDATYGPQGFTSSGFKLGRNNVGENPASASCVAWSFLQADKFFKLGTFTHAGGVADSIDLSSLGVVGWVHIKRLDANGDWYVWTRGLTAGNNLVLNTSAGESTTNAFISVSGTTLTFAAEAPAGNYTIQAWAHNQDAKNGIVQAGRSVQDSSGVFTVPHGWANGAQWLLYKAASTSGVWLLLDTVRTPSWSGSDAFIRANTTDAEASANLMSQADGTIIVSDGQPNATMVWCVIRAPIT